MLPGAARQSIRRGPKRLCLGRALLHEEEHPLPLKTRATLTRQVEVAVRALHPYDVPPIIRIEATANADDLSWVAAVTQAL
ncbi:MAG: divalent cation tolerance protein CutA [Pseudomonadota bacterium]